MNISSCILSASRILHRFSEALLHTLARRPASLLPMHNMSGRSGLLGVKLQPAFCLLDPPRVTLPSCRTVIDGPLYRPPIDYKDDAFWQIMNNLKPKKKKDKKRPLDGNPYMKGVVLKTLIRNPKKPNSGNRKCVLVRLSNGKEKLAKIPGIGHNLQEHHVVLVQCGRTKDTPGLKIKVVRGKYDCAHVVKKKQM